MAFGMGTCLLAHADAHLTSSDQSLSIDDILSSTLPAPAPAEQECSHRVNSKRILFYFDLNSAYREMEIAKRVACELGLRFESYPSLADSRAAGIPYEKWEFARDRLGACRESKTCSTSERLKQLETEEADTKKEAETAAGPVAFVPAVEFNKKMVGFAKEGAKIVEMGVSGHHYEYGWWGDFLAGKVVAGALRGDVFHETFLDQDDVTPTTRSYPEVFTELKVLTLWGCSSVTPDKIDFWKMAFPNVKIIIGFNGSAPAAIRSTSLDYLSDSLKRANSMTVEVSPEEIRANIESLESINETFAGVYFKSLSNKEYLYRVTSPREANGAGGEFGLFSNPQRCIDFKRRMEYELSYLKELENGSSEIPEDGSDSQLWSVYFNFQMNSDCYRGTPFEKTYPSSRIGLLRFFESGVKFNFEKVYDLNLKKASLELRAVRKDRRFSPIYQWMKTTSQTVDIGQFIHTQKRAAILKLSGDLMKVAHFLKKKSELRFITLAMQKLLVELHPECTEMLTWHEVSGRIPLVSCKIEDSLK